MNIKKHLLITILLIIWAIPIHSQLRVNSPNKRVDYSQPSTSSIQFLDPEKFTVNHSFSLSMSSIGGQSFSYGVYSNRLRYIISDKWALTTDINLIQPTFSSLPTGVNSYQGQVQYGVQLQYKPTENTLFQFRFDNYPRYSRYRVLPGYSSLFFGEPE